MTHAARHARPEPASDKAEHVHGNGEECFPGCPPYEIARAWYDAYAKRSRGGVGPLFEHLGEMAERILKSTVQELLEEGVILAPGQQDRSFLARELVKALAEIDRLKTRPASCTDSYGGTR